MLEVPPEIEAFVALCGFKLEHPKPHAIDHTERLVMMLGAMNKKASEYIWADSEDELWHNVCEVAQLLYTTNMTGYR